MVSVLVTGGSGRTGRAVVRALARAGHRVQVLTRQAGTAEALRGVDGVSPVIGDLSDEADVARAVAGVDALYHIPPNMHPDEIAFGQRIVRAARGAGTKHVIYHSVLHPQIEALAHHWNKLMVEQAVIESGLPFTILQPASYMQNTQTDWRRIAANGVHTLGFSVAARLSLVDLEDVAEAAAIVTGRTGHAGAIYELAGPEMLSGEDKAHILTRVLGRPVRAVHEPLDEFRRKAAGDGVPAHVIATRAAMFAHYDHQGLAGNSRVLEMLLGRPATTFEQFATRVAAAQ